MFTFARFVVTIGLAVTAWCPTGARAADPAARPTIVAAENFYADIARQVAGPDIPITSVMSNPDEDPHLFEASPSVARALSGARLVILNGVDYDPWMTKLLGAARSTDRRVIVVADLLNKKTGDNPHLWYDPSAAVAVSKAVATALSAIDPAAASSYGDRAIAFIASLTPLTDKIAAMRARYSGTSVTATEPVFGYMATALGLAMRNERFQLAVMNDTEPSASDTAAFERDLRTHRARVLLYNSQATDSSAKRLLAIARRSGVPVVGVTETEPPGATYQSWMLKQLDALDTALSAPRP